MSEYDDEQRRSQSADDNMQPDYLQDSDYDDGSLNKNNDQPSGDGNNTAAGLNNAEQQAAEQCANGQNSSQDNLQNQENSVGGVKNLFNYGGKSKGRAGFKGKLKEETKKRIILALIAGVGVAGLVGGSFALGPYQLWHYATNLQDKFDYTTNSLDRHDKNF